MSINDYMTNKGRPVPAIPFSINVKTTIANGTAAGDDPELVSEVARRIRDLPDRLWINSRPVINLLNSLSKWRLDHAMVHPLVLQRPFKILVHNEDLIREHMAELNTRFAQGVDSVPTEAPSSIFPSPWLCYHRP
jgi:hypothetical protein